MHLSSRFVSTAGMIRLGHDPGDPQLCSHCPFCGSGQITGRSDGGIDCAFCGHSFIVRIQPAFPGMPQAPGMGSPTDAGPDMPGGMPGMEMGMAPPGAGPDEMPPGEDGMPPGEDGEEGMPPGAGDEEGPPQEEDDDGPPPPKGKKKASLVSYSTLAGDKLTEDQYVRHLAVMLSGSSPAVLAQIRREAAGDPEYVKHYSRGWRSAERYSLSGYGDSPLEKADRNGEPNSWYHGYEDHASGRPKFHSRDCQARQHDAPGCALADDGQHQASRRTGADGSMRGMSARTPEERDRVREYMRGQGTQKASLVLQMMERRWEDADHAEQCPAGTHSNVSPECTLGRQASRRTGAVLNPGAIVQYKGVGQAVVGRHTCPEGQCPGSGPNSHQYELDFISGPKNYREGGTRAGWVGPDDVVMQKSHRQQFHAGSSLSHRLIVRHAQLREVPAALREHLASDHGFPPGDIQGVMKAGMHRMHVTDHAVRSDDAHGSHRAPAEPWEGSDAARSPGFVAARFVS